MSDLNDVDLRLVRVFLAVVRNHGYSAAQTELNMTTATISHHMKTLESRLGFTLCTRGRGGFSLTPRGVQFLIAAERMLIAVDRFNSDIGELAGDLSGVLRIGAVDSALFEYASPFADILKRYNARDHATQILLDVIDGPECEKRIFEGELDVGFVCLPRKLKGLDYDLAYDERQELYCAKTHPLFDVPDDRIRLETLASLKIVSRNLWLHHEVERLSAFKPAALVNNIHAKATLVRTGDYAGFMPASFARQWVEAGELRPIRPADLGWVANYYVISKTGSIWSPIVKTFLEDVRQVLKARAQ